MNFTKALLAASYLLYSVAVAADEVYDQKSVAFPSDAKKTDPIYVSSDDPAYANRAHAATRTPVKEQKAPLPAALTEPRVIRIDSPVSSVQSTNNSLLFMFQDVTKRTDKDRADSSVVTMEFRHAQIDALTKAAAGKHNQ